MILSSIRQSKAKFLSIFSAALLSISTTSFSVESDIQGLDLLHQKGELSALFEQLSSLGYANYSPEHFQLYVYALADIDLDKAEEAADKAIQTFDTNPDMFLMHAEIMGRQAQNSVFSILAYAKKAKNSLEIAVKLAPNEPKYLQGLMTFHLFAPSIAGGDTEQALVHANAISTLDEELGYSAIASYHWAVDNNDNAISILKEGLTKYPSSFTLLGQKADLYVNDEKYSDAIATYSTITQQTITALPTSQGTDEGEDASEDYEQKSYTLLNAHYQIGRVALLSNTQLELGIEHLQRYIELYQSAEYNLSGLPSLDWAHLRLAGLLFANEEVLTANNALEQINKPDAADIKSVHKKLSKKISRAVKKLR